MAYQSIIGTEDDETSLTQWRIRKPRNQSYSAQIVAKSHKKYRESKKLYEKMRYQSIKNHTWHTDAKI